MSGYAVHGFVLCLSAYVLVFMCVCAFCVCVCVSTVDSPLTRLGVGFCLVMGSLFFMFLGMLNELKGRGGV